MEHGGSPFLLALCLWRSLTPDPPLNPFHAQVISGTLHLLAEQVLSAMDDMPVGARVWHLERGEGEVTEHLTNPARIAIRFAATGKVKKYAHHSWDMLTTTGPPDVPPDLIARCSSMSSTLTAKGRENSTRRTAR